MPTSIELYSSIIRQSSVSEALPGTKVLPVTLFHPPFTYQDVKNRENSYSFGRSFHNFSKPAFRARRRRVWPKNQKSVPQPCYFAASAPSSFLRPHKRNQPPAKWTAITEVDTKKKPGRRITRHYAALLRISNGVRPYFISIRS